MEADKLVGLEYGNGDGYGNGYGNGYGDGNGDGYGNGDGLVLVSHETPIIGFWRMGSRLHFSKDIDTKTGAAHKWPYIPKLCEHGLHACLDPGDTNKWNSGKLFKVACSGWVKFQNDKFVCTRRVILGEG